MKCRQASSGYTIIEVLIYLTVSSALLLSSMLLINGKAERTRYTQSVGTMEQQIKDIMNDVSTGFYPTQADFNCVLNNGQLTFPTASPTGLGTNEDCVFLGKAIKLDANSAQYTAYTMAASRNATGFSNAAIQLLGVSGNPGIAEVIENQADLQVVKTVSLTDPGRTVSGIAMVSDFSQTSSLNNSVSGNAAEVTMYELTGNYFSSLDPANIRNADRGVILCLQQAGGGKKAALTIGASGQLSTETKLEGEWPAEC